MLHSVFWMKYYEAHLVVIIASKQNQSDNLSDEKAKCQICKCNMSSLETLRTDIPKSALNRSLYFFK